MQTLTSRCPQDQRTCNHFVVQLADSTKHTCYPGDVVVVSQPHCLGDVALAVTGTYTVFLIGHLAT